MVGPSNVMQTITSNAQVLNAAGMAIPEKHHLDCLNLDLGYDLFFARVFNY